MTNKEYKIKFTRKRLSAAELGRLQIEYTCVKHKKNVELFDMKTFAQKLSALSFLEKREFEHYSDLHRWIASTYNNTLTKKAFCIDSYKNLKWLLLRYYSADTAQRVKTHLPVVMTETEFKEYRSKGLERLLDNTRPFSRVNLLAYVYEYYSELLHRSPRRKNPLSLLKASYSAAPVTSPIYRDRFNESMMIGEIEFLDETELAKRLTDKNGDLKDQAIEAFKKGVGFTDISEERPFTFKPSKDFPENYDKWKAVTISWNGLKKIYPIFQKDYDDAENGLELLKDFSEHFSELKNVLSDEVNKAFPGLMDAPLEDWFRQVKTPRELYESNLVGYADSCDEKALRQDERAKYNGVAVFKALPLDMTISRKTKYEEPTLEDLIGEDLSIGLGELYPESNQREAAASRVASLRDSMEKNYKTVAAFNAAIDVLSKIYGIKTLNYLKVETSDLLKDFRSLNAIAAILFNKFKNEEKKMKTLDGRDRELYELYQGNPSKKAAALLEHFSPIFPEGFYPTEKNVETLAGRLLSKQHFYERQNLLDAFIRDTEA